MSRPKREDGELAQLSTYVPSTIDAAMKNRAKAEGRTKRELVVAALSAYLTPTGQPHDEDGEQDE